MRSSVSLYAIFGCGSWLLGCQPPPSLPSADAQEATLTASVQREPVKPAQGPAWVGTWASASCAGRTYSRQITLDADQTFTARDLVSPCPPGVQCVWSGVVARRGTWRRTTEGASLQADPSSGAGAPFPNVLTWDEGLRAPVEQVEGARCAYLRLAPQP